MFYLYFHSLTFALQENGPFTKSCEVSAFPAAVSRDEIEQLRVQAAAAVRSYREALATAATDAQGGTTADDARTDLRLIRQEANHAAASRDEVEPLRFQGAEAIRARDTGLRYEQLKRQADKAWYVERVAPRKPKNLIAASYNIPICGVKYPNPRRNPLKRCKLE